MEDFMKFRPPIGMEIPEHILKTKTVVPDAFLITLHIRYSHVAINDEYKRYDIEILHNYRHAIPSGHIYYSHSLQTVIDMFWTLFQDLNLTEAQYPEIYVQYDDGDQEYELAKLDSDMKSYYPIGEEPVDSKARRIVYFKLVFADHRCVRKDFRSDLSHVKPAKRI